MALNITPKTNPSNPNSQPAAKPVAKMNQASAFKNKAAALKDTLRQAPTVAPRPGGSSARAEQFAKQPKYPIPPLANQQAPQAPAAPQQKLSDVPPPPSGAVAQRAGIPAAVVAAEAAAAGVPAGQPEAAHAEGGEAADRASVGLVPASAPGSASQPTISTDPAATPAEASSVESSPQFAALARRERQIRKTQLELKAAQEAWKQEQAKYISRDQLTSDPLKVLAEAGLSYDRLVELQLNQVAPDPNQALQDKITQLEEKLARVDKTFEERDTMQEQQALRQIKSDVELLVESDPTYETIKALESVGEVVDLIHKVFKAEGVVLSVEEAAKAVEDKLADREFARLEKMSQLQKIKSRLAPKAPTAAAVTPVEEVAATSPLQQQPLASPTLTNAGSVSTRQLSPRDRIIARLKGGI